MLNYAICVCEIFHIVFDRIDLKTAKSVTNQIQNVHAFVHITRELTTKMGGMASIWIVAALFKTPNKELSQSITIGIPWL
jgi:hypothetical protein